MVTILDSEVLEKASQRQRYGILFPFRYNRMFQSLMCLRRYQNNWYFSYKSADERNVRKGM